MNNSQRSGNVSREERWEKKRKPFIQWLAQTGEERREGRGKKKGKSNPRAAGVTV